MSYIPSEFTTAAVINANTLFQNYDDEIQQLMADTGTYLEAEMAKVYTETGNIVTSGIGINRVENIASLKLQDGLVFNTIEVLGYYTKGDGGGGTFYWDLTSTETDNGGTIIQATGINPGRWKRVFSGAVNIKWFGVKGDGVTDDTIAVARAINYSNLLTGNGGTYRISSVLNVEKENDFIMYNFNFISTSKNEEEAQIIITSSAKVGLNNITFNGKASTKYTNDSKWIEQVGGQIYGKSVWCVPTNIFSITSPFIIIDNIKFEDVIVQSCIRLTSIGDSSLVFASNLSFKDTSFCTIVCDGGTTDSQKYITNYYSKNNGLLPETFLVKEIGSSLYSTTAHRADRIFFNQGAFGARLMNDTNYIVDNFTAINYASSALVSDINNSFIGSNIKIISNDNRYISNNTTASIYCELTKTVQINNICIDIVDRNILDTSTWGIYFYQDNDAYNANLSDVIVNVASGDFISDCIHSVHNYGGNIDISNVKIKSSSNNAYSSRINFSDGYSGDISLKYLSVDGTANILCHDVSKITLIGCYTDGEIYCGNYSVGGVTDSVDISMVKCSKAILSSIKGNTNIDNLECNEINHMSYGRPQKILNNTFTSTSNWIKESTGGTFAVSDNKATIINTGIYQSITSLVVGETYSVKVYFNKELSTTSGEIFIFSGIAGGDILSTVTCQHTGIYTLEFTATSTVHSVYLANPANSNTMVYGGVFINEKGLSDININNLNVLDNSIFNFQGTVFDKFSLTNSKIYGGGAKVVSGYNDIIIKNNLLYSNSSAASATITGISNVVFSENIVTKGSADLETTYNQISTVYNYYTAPVNVNNINTRG